MKFWRILWYMKYKRLLLELFCIQDSHDLSVTLLGWISLTGTGLKMPSNMLAAGKVFLGHGNQLLVRHLYCRLLCCPWNAPHFIGLPWSDVFFFIWPLAFIVLKSNCSSVKRSVVYLGSWGKNHAKNTTKILNNMKKSRSPVNASEVLLKGTSFSPGWGQRGER